MNSQGLTYTVYIYKYSNAWLNRIITHSFVSYRSAFLRVTRGALVYISAVHIIIALLFDSQLEFVKLMEL